MGRLLCIGAGNIVVVDDFLPAALFTSTLTAFQQQQVRTTDDKTLRHGQNVLAQDVKLTVPLEVHDKLHELVVVRGASCSGDHDEAITDESRSIEGAAGPDRVGLAEMSGQVQRGDRPDHADVACSGCPVAGHVCLLYLSGQGALIFTDVVTGEEHTVHVRPNRAVSWPNTQHTHRVEAALGHADEPRSMLGPYFSADDASGTRQLARCGVQAFARPPPGLGNFICCVAAACVCASVVFCAGVVYVVVHLTG